MIRKTFVCRICKISFLNILNLRYLPCEIKNHQYYFISRLIGGLKSIDIKKSLKSHLQ